jgi:hypothetical protein
MKLKWQGTTDAAQALPGRFITMLKVIMYLLNPVTLCLNTKGHNTFLLSPSRPTNRDTVYTGHSTNKTNMKSQFSNTKD